MALFLLSQDFGDHQMKQILSSLALNPHNAPMTLDAEKAMMACSALIVLKDTPEKTESAAKNVRGISTHSSASLVSISLSLASLLWSSFNHIIA
jgi:hypothetical protein